MPSERNDLKSVIYTLVQCFTPEKPNFAVFMPILLCAHEYNMITSMPLCRIGNAPKEIQEGTFGAFA
jgi:hypothetical protein